MSGGGVRARVPRVQCILVVRRGSETTIFKTATNGSHAGTIGQYRSYFCASARPTDGLWVRWCRPRVIGERLRGSMTEAEQLDLENCARELATVEGVMDAAGQEP